MLKLLIIADDFTGALDTSVQCAKRNAVTKVVVKKEPDFGKARDEGVEVLVWNMESRHLDAEKSYSLVYSIVKKAREFGIPHIYKKTDSGLRGNVASELTAMLKASGESFLPFLPAFPKMNRVTVGGVQYVDGQKLEESIYGKDPFEPARVSYIPDLFQDYDVKATVCSTEELPGICHQERTVGVFDARTQEDLEQEARALLENGALTICAGCAGFASALAEVLELGQAERRMEDIRLPARMFVACGSLNRISREQLDYAQSHGFTRITLDPQKHRQPDYLASEAGKKWMERLKQCYREAPCCILDIASTNSDNRKGDGQSVLLERSGVEQQLRKVLKSFLDSGVDNTALVIGGDTLLAYFECIGCEELTPVLELRPGLVLSEMNLNGRKRWVISKSGGFGDRKLLTELWNEILDKEKASALNVN